MYSLYHSIKNRLSLLLIITCLGQGSEALGQTAANQLFWVQSSGTASLDQLVSSDLDGSNVTVLASGAANFVNPLNVEVDRAHSYLFVADANLAGGTGITRYDLSGNNRTTVAPYNASFQYNDLEVGSNKLYWVQSSGTASLDQLVSANLDGTNPVVLASGATNFNNPQNLAVDQTHGYIYVADVAGGSGITRYDLNGGNRVTIAANSASFSYNDVQQAGNKIYWVQSSGTASLDQLVAADLDGSNVTVLASGAANFSNPQNLAVDYLSGYIFVGDASGGSGITRYDLTGGNRTTIAANSASFVYNGLALNSIYVILPLQWGVVTATAEEHRIRLDWTTWDEVNTDHFELERATGGGIFNRIASMAAKGAVQNHYEFADSTVAGGQTYTYRIRQVDRDGRFSYSATVRAASALSGPEVIVAANPVYSELSISVAMREPAVAIVLVRGMSGMVLLEKEVRLTAGRNSFYIPCASLPGGTYLLTVQTGQQRYQRLLVKTP